MAPPGPTIGTHFKRAIGWNLAEIVVTPREQASLNASGVAPVLHGLLAWRRSTLIIATPILLLSVILAMTKAAQADVSSLTSLGKFLNYLPVIGLLLIPVGALRVVARWTELRRSSRFLMGCWMASIVIPLIVALVPLDLLMDLSGARANVDPTVSSQLEAVIFGARMILAVNAAITLLPVLLSMPGGLLRGAARVKSLFPGSTLVGWFLIVVAPFYSVIAIVVFALLDQIVGNGLLMVAVALLAFSPWLYVIYRGIYGRPMSSEQARSELPRANRFGSWLLLLAVFFIVIFALTAKVGQTPVVGSGDAVLSYTQVLLVGSEVFSRAMVATVVFATLFLNMVHAEWRAANAIDGDLRREHNERMTELSGHLQRGTDSPS
ncbi:MAG: hypothetical protein FWD74_05350 [Actinomycetia bacterium]|nr:hypothetical protein [Actinomycetes bacterium]